MSWSGAGGFEPPAFCLGMGQHVEWLFRRITPVDDDKPQNSFLTPRLLIQELQEKMGDEAPLERTVKAACSKAAKLVGISISSGARTPKTLLPRER